MASVLSRFLGNYDEASDSGYTYILFTFIFWKRFQLMKNIIKTYGHMSLSFIFRAKKTNMSGSWLAGNHLC